MDVQQINSLSEKEFAALFHGIRAKIKEDPIANFIKAQGFLNFTPTPAQTVALKSVFGIPLDPTTQHSIYQEQVAPDTGQFALSRVPMTEVQLYEFMTDLVYDPTNWYSKTRLDFICGRRSGKSTIASMLSILFAVTKNWRPFLVKHPYATVLILSHSKELSEEILDLIREFMDGSPVLNRLLDRTEKKKDTRTAFHLRVPFLLEDGSIQYSRVAIRVGAASKKTTRGKAVCALLCDEIAYWNLSENAKERDEDILRAARPAMGQFGDEALMIKLSSPGIKQGVLYGEYQKRKELPDSYIVFKAPSWVWNTLLEEKYYREEYMIDPTGFASEFRGDFVDSISNFILPESLALCILKGKKSLPPEEKEKEVTYYAALDAAFKGDRFAFAVVGIVNNRIRQYVMKTWQGTRQAPVKAKDVAEYARTVCMQYNLGEVFADQYSFQPLSEIFEEYSVKLSEKPFTNTFKKQIYFNLKKVIHNQQIDILDDQLQLNEIRQLQVEQTNTGLVRIGHPPGGHDDCSDALSIATFVATEAMNSGNAEMGEFAVGSVSQTPVDPMTGKAFRAPDAEMLGEVYGSEIVDNSGDWEYDKESGTWVKVSDGDDEPGGGHGGNFIF